VVARARLFGAIGATLARAAAGRPLLLVIDDLHWAIARRSSCSRT